jgi:hypothetical protein
MTSLITALWAVAAIWAVAAVQTYSLAVRRSRVGVRRGALRARTALLSGAVAGPAVAVAAGFVSVPRALAMAPLLVLPAVVAVWRALPPLRGLARTLRTDPWGPSDPRTRRAAAEPALTVPPLSALACAPAAALVLTGGWLSALVAYVLAAAITMAVAWRAPHRRETAARAGVLRRVVVGAAPPAASRMGPAAGREAA